MKRFEEAKSIIKGYIGELMKNGLSQKEANEIARKLITDVEKEMLGGSK